MCQLWDCCLSEEDAALKAKRGIDRGPTPQEMEEPLDQRPWTEYDVQGSKQQRPPFKACTVKMGVVCGPPCCVVECQWPEWLCGPDADQTCDVCCRCDLGRAKLCCCAGPQCNDTSCCSCFGSCCSCCSCCYGNKPKITVQEACECDCLSNACGPRYAGCQLCCCHCSCVQCPPCLTYCCCCKEETLFMDGDLKPIKAPEAATMVRNET
ncbi:hypothetical protein AB1Y20_016723 [Prymnesium parvum]|uniref:Uncharacterized protein n=1 Tax=Prymnesium parvum TaxID=97485 RepID=A0AB34IBS5_PRYPA